MTKQELDYIKVKQAKQRAEQRANKKLLIVSQMSQPTNDAPETNNSPTILDETNIENVKSKLNKRASPVSSYASSSSSSSTSSTSYSSISPGLTTQDQRSATQHDNLLIIQNPKNANEFENLENSNKYKFLKFDYKFYSFLLSIFCVITFAIIYQYKIENSKAYRLTDSIIPKTYDLLLTPNYNIRNYTFNGEVNITVEINETTNTITLNAGDNLNIYEKKINLITTLDNLGKELQITKDYLIRKYEFYVIHLKEPLQKGLSYNLHFKFNGRINGQPKGFFVSEYDYKIYGKTYNGNHYFSTMLKTNYTRTVFPCFDEPQFKATFRFQLGRKLNMKTLFNTERILESIAISNTYLLDRYTETELISTNSLNFVIVDLSDFRNIPYNRTYFIWSIHNTINYNTYSKLKEQLDWHINYFGNEFNINLDFSHFNLIVLPNFPVPVITNTNLMTFRESSFLIYENNSSTKQMINSIETLSNGIARLIFGNLITVKLWSDEWLTQGLSSYFGLMSANNFMPSLKLANAFIPNVFQQLFNAVKDDVPVLNEYHQHNGYLENDIYRERSTVIVRMLDNILPKGVLERAIIELIKNKLHQGITQQDLWHEIRIQLINYKYKDIPSIENIMNSWSSQSEFPVLNVTRNYRKLEIVFSQETFHNRMQNIANNNENYNKKFWWLPITYTTEVSPYFCIVPPKYWLQTDGQSLHVHERRLFDENWLIVNIQQIGFYRVNYDLNNWQNIIRYLENNNTYAKIHPLNRAQLVDDSLNLARFGYISYDLALNLTKYLIHEIDSIPWISAINNFKYLDFMLMGEIEYLHFKNYMLHLFDNHLDALNINFVNAHHLSNDKIEIYSMACHLDHKNCTQNSLELFKLWQEQYLEDNPIPANVRPFTYCSAIKHGTPKQWEFLFRQINGTTAINLEKDIILKALACTKESHYINRLLNVIKYKEFDVNYNDLLIIYEAISQNVNGLPLIIKFIQSNWLQLTKITSSTEEFLNLITIPLSTIKHEFYLDQLKNIIKVNIPNYEDYEIISKSFDTANEHILWMKTYYNTITNWFHAIPFSTDKF